MPNITFEKVTKSYGTTEVLREFSVSVPDGEFLVLLGPSGCGKSTLLRMIAGLTDITSGSVTFDGEEVNRWDVRRRNVAFVLQSYALYPQLTVAQNIAFPMLMASLKSWHHAPIVGPIVRRRLMRSPEIRDKVDAIAAQLQLTELLDRRPAKLSGGQRQRVALARSLVREPSLYLLDEPLSNLDATLRTQMRSDLITLHRTVGKTFVFVIHDQVEAMTMASTIIVIRAARRSAPRGGQLSARADGSTRSWSGSDWSAISARSAGRHDRSWRSLRRSTGGTSPAALRGSCCRRAPRRSATHGRRKR
jgi:multiple sugar transport system ATP-binding protein